VLTLIHRKRLNIKSLDVIRTDITCKLIHTL